MKEKLMKNIKIVKKFISANKSLCMKIMAGVIIIIAILFIVSCFKGNQYGNSVGNSSNLGLAIQDGNWIYYVELDDGDPVGIYKIKNNGNDIEKVTEGAMYYLNIIDNYIYCLEYDEDDDQNNLIKIKTNGKDKETLASNIDENQIVATDKYVYYFKKDKLYRVNLSGTKREEISDKEISYYQIEGNWIYYIYENESSQYIAKMKLDGEDTERIAKADDEQNYEALYVNSGKVYYILSERDENYNYEYYLYKMNKKGDNVEQICKIDSNIQTINMQEDIIYYTTTSDYSEYSINSIKYNGTDKITLTEKEDVESINITEDWIVFLSWDDEYDTVIKMISKNGEEEKDL